MAHNIEYNSSKSLLLFPEYGRSVQEMIEASKTIPDLRKRQATVEAIIKLMYQLLPGNKTFDDQREKLWKHVFAISKYEIDVQPPPGIDVSPEGAKTKPGRVEYPPITRQMRHYGQNVHSMIRKCIELPEGPKKHGYTEIIAAYMKLAYKTWNREHYVSDDVVKDDLEILSNGQLRLDDGHGSLDILANQIGIDDQNSGGKGGKRRRGRGSSKQKSEPASSSGGAGRKRGGRRRR